MHVHHEAHGITCGSIVLLSIISAVIALYLWHVWYVKRHGGKWSPWCTASFMVGAGMLMVGSSPMLMTWAHADMGGHMAQHLLIGMFSPIFLVMGAPVSLALKSLPPFWARRLTALFKSRFFRTVSHPMVAMLLNIGGMYALYLTPLYVISLTNPYLHYVIHFHFLAAGYLFTWAIIGLDPVPERPSLRTRAWVLFLSIAAHAYLGKHMYAHLLPAGSPFSDEEIRAAVKMMYYWGDLSELILAVFFFAKAPLLRR